jgi:hypothetical protein
MDQPQRGPASLSTAVLVFANAIPLFGVLFLGWKVFPLILLYWLENVIVGGFNVLRMLTADPRDPIRWIGKAFLIPFFCVHFGGFTFVHGVFVFAMFGGPAYTHQFFPSLAGIFAAIRQTGIGFAVLGLILSHGVSFVGNYLLGGEYRQASLQQLMSQPYGRVIVMHLVILGGGFLVLALHSPVPALAVLVLLKIAVDLRAHRAERRRLGGETAAPAAAVEPSL